MHHDISKEEFILLRLLVAEHIRTQTHPKNLSKSMRSVRGNGEYHLRVGIHTDQVVNLTNKNHNSAYESKFDT